MGMGDLHSHRSLDFSKGELFLLAYTIRQDQNTSNGGGAQSLCCIVKRKEATSPKVRLQFNTIDLKPIGIILDPTFEWGGGLHSVRYLNISNKETVALKMLGEPKRFLIFERILHERFSV